MNTYFALPKATIFKVVDDMVESIEAVQNSKKRESFEVNNVPNDEGAVKKPRIESPGEEDLDEIMIDEDNNSNGVSAKPSEKELMRLRIKKYLEDNKSLKFIDEVTMAKVLHTQYPEYKRRKFKAFKGQISLTFKHYTAEIAVARKKEKEERKQRKLNASKDALEEVRIDDETTVNGPSMNNRLSNLYSKNVPDEDEEEAAKDVCEIIDDDEPAETAEVNATPEEEEAMSEFEKTKQIVQFFSEKFEKQMKSNQVKSKTPSKSLSNFLTKSTEISSTNGVDPRSPLMSVSVSGPASPLASSTASKHHDVIPRSPANKRAESIEEVSIDEADITDKLSSPKKKLTNMSTSSSGVKKRKKMEISVSNPKLTFADFGGSESVLKNICKLLVHLKHPEVYLKLGVTPPRGFLLHGPPGCGKTLLAHAIAGELELPFIKISAPEIVSGVSGDSEKKLRELFDQAVETSPCVLFIDEIDCITPKRESAGKEMERRIVAQLLTCLDQVIT